MEVQGLGQEDQRVDGLGERVDRVELVLGLRVGLAGDVSSWYKNGKGRVTQNWPFPLIDYWNATRRMNAAISRSSEPRPRRHSSRRTRQRRATGCGLTPSRPLIKVGRVQE